MSTRRRSQVASCSMNTMNAAAGTSGTTRPKLSYVGLSETAVAVLQRRPLQAHTEAIKHLLKAQLQQFLRANNHSYKAGDVKPVLVQQILEMVSKFEAPNVCAAGAGAAGGNQEGVFSEELLRSLPVETVQLLKRMEQSSKEEVEALLLSYGEVVITSEPKVNLLKQLANMLSEQTRAQEGVEARKQQESPEAKRARVSMIRECSVCMENSVSAGFSPCGHAVSCVDCAGKLQTCPICRKAVESVLHLYFS